MTVIVSGVGCSLVDRIFDNVDFGSSQFLRLLSRQPGDGGLMPGKLVLEEDLECFANQQLVDILPQLSNHQCATTQNIGGPCVVALIHASQLAYRESVIRFYGCYGDDSIGQHLYCSLKKTPIDLTYFEKYPGYETASTTVLSDPTYDNGHGERTFINTIGASGAYQPENVDDSFYESDICVFGGTALVPKIHSHLEMMLLRARQHGALTLVNTVYDYPNEHRNPTQRWPMGAGDNSYRLIDILVTDCEEALRLSGKTNIPLALSFFMEKGVSAVIVTNGSHPVSLVASSSPFSALPITFMPVTTAISEELQSSHRGDSTGCGDNFVGGVIASLVWQKQTGVQLYDLREAARWGIVSGGFAGFYYGGTYIEQWPGEKLSLIAPYYEKYQNDEK